MRPDNEGLESLEYRSIIERSKVGKHLTLESSRKWLKNSEFPHEEGRKIVAKVNDYCTEYFNKAGIAAYQVGKRIGQGAYGAVKMAHHISTQCPVAVKVYEKYKLIDT